MPERGSYLKQVLSNEEGTVDELVPVILGIVLGALIWRTTKGYSRGLLSVSAVAVSGLAATVLSGEYHESWMYLLLDLGEAAFGLAIGFVVAHRLLKRRGANAHIVPERSPPNP
jgi:hypothetical protein